MKQIILALICLSLISAYASAQSRGPESLRGLKGIRLVIMFEPGEVLDQTQRAEVLTLLQSEAKSKFLKAGIPLFQYAQEIEAAGSPQLLITITLNKPNGFVHPLDTRVKLLQKVRLARDPAIELDVTTWETFGIGGPELEVQMIHSQIATEVDMFIEDYLTANPK
jgi:hypothetical protein